MEKKIEFRNHKNQNKFILFILLILLVSINVKAQTPIIVNTNNEGTPISKYVYGQFIEHLGKSVYGGLWAEMILDRKFYFPITDQYDPWGEGQPDSWWGGSVFPFLKASPWKVMGVPGSVSMDSITPFTGKYAVIINSSGDGTISGISHEGLGLVKGKTYTGNIVLSGERGALPVSVKLVISKEVIAEQVISEIDSVYKYYPFCFTSTVTTDSAKLEITGKGSGLFKIGILSLMPSDNINGWRADVVSLLKDLNSPVYRWPGGNFVSGYDWRDGIGNRDKRPARKNPAWTGIEPNDVGIHEFMDLMKIIGSEPFLALNMGLGNVEDAAAEVEYCNGDTTTTEGKIRAANGHPEPFSVKYWAVGNEMFGNWQLGYMPIADYEAKHNAAAKLIREVDSSAQIIAVGDVGTNWSKPMLTVCGDYMNLISEHKYCKDNSNMVTHINAIANEVKSVAAAHRSYRKTVDGLEAKNIRIAFDEYNYWYGDNPYGQLGIIYHQKDGLGVAVGLHEMFKNSDLFFMANYAQTVNVLGCIKTSQTAASLEATALPLMLYRNHFGEIPVEVTGSTSKLNVSAAFSSDKDSLSIAVVNSQDKDVYYKVDLRGARQLMGYWQWEIANPDPNAYNEPGKDPRIVIEEHYYNRTIDSILVPAYGLVMVKFPVENRTSVGQIYNSKLNFLVYPNPAGDNLNIDYFIVNESEVTTRIIDLSGRVILNIDRKIKTPGKYLEQLKIDNLLAGIYFCELVVGGNSQYKKLIIN